MAEPLPKTLPILKPGPFWGRLDLAETKFRREALPEFVDANSSIDPKRMPSYHKQYIVPGQVYGRRRRGDRFS
jgi:hypothetical protein